MTARLKTAPQVLRHQADPYAGADMANAQRLGAVLWALFTVLIALLWIPSPPTEAIGSAGWIVAVAILALAAALVSGLRRGRVMTTWSRMLLVSYGAMVAIAVLQWLAGGIGSPYERLSLLPILFVAMLHPPRKIAAFMGFVALILAAPFVYDGSNSDALGATFATFVIWSALAGLGSVLMARRSRPASCPGGPGGQGPRGGAPGHAHRTSQPPRLRRGAGAARWSERAARTPR